MCNDETVGIQPSRADVLLRSVGTATPRVAAAIAGALELPAEFVVDTIYRAPGRLLANVDAIDAERLAQMLAGIGLDAVAVPPGTGVVRGPLLDIAAQLINPLLAEAVADALGRFIGCTPAAALDLLLTPPGIVLGNVTRPTLEALRAVLPSGAVALTASEPDRAHYALFATNLTPAHRAAIAPFLAEKCDPADDGSVTCFDLTRANADALWRRLHAPQGTRIVNQDFLTFTLVLTAMPDDAGRGAEALSAIADVPAEVYGDIAALLPCPILERLRYADVPERLAALAEAGFAARADLETFASHVLTVRSAPPGTLAAVGLVGTAPCATPPMPRARALMIRAQLEAAGADVFLA